LEDLGEGGGTFFEKKGSPALSKPLPPLPRSFLKGEFFAFYNVRRSMIRCEKRSFFDILLSVAIIKNHPNPRHKLQKRHRSKCGTVPFLKALGR
jgi:hypothetical protein